MQLLRHHLRKDRGGSWQCVVGTPDRPFPWFLLVFLSVLRWILRRLVFGFVERGDDGGGYFLYDGVTAVHKY